MSKIYEALESIELERTPKAATVTPKPISLGLPDSLEEKLLAMYQRIETAINLPRTPFVEFAGIGKGEGASRLVYAFAKVAAARLKKRVLLVAGGRTPRIRAMFSGEDTDRWEDALRGGKFVDAVAQPPDESLGQAVMLAGPGFSVQHILMSQQSESIINDLRERFDLVLIDAPPLGESSNALLLTSIADGVVLVVEAGRTRWQVAKHAMDQVAQHQRQVLGVIINKRRFYIPEFIYRRL